MPDELPALPDLGALPLAVGRAMNKALYECGLIWKREAVANAPRSPKMSEIRAVRKKKWEAKGKKPTKKQKAAWKKRINPRAKSRPAPGGLERSISMWSHGMPRWDGSYVEVFVKQGAEAGKYAKKIHDEKGKSWRNRGPGTIAKGSRADDKFIERAMTDNLPKFEKKLVNALGRAVEEALKA